jgi:hypothetical protein
MVGGRVVGKHSDGRKKEGQQSDGGKFGEVAETSGGKTIRAGRIGRQLSRGRNVWGQHSDDEMSWATQ